VGFTTLNPKGEVVPALVLAFPWRITLGTLVTFLVAVCFSTSSSAKQRMIEKNASC
jgi:hypothetical protein